MRATPAIYEALKSRAEEVWARIANPPRTLIKVGVATCSRVVGAEETLEALRREVEMRGLELDVMVTGCLGLCYAEPLVEIIYPRGQATLYHKVTADKVPALVSETVATEGVATAMALAITGGGGYG